MCSYFPSFKGHNEITSSGNLRSTTVSVDQFHEIVKRISTSRWLWFSVLEDYEVRLTTDNVVSKESAFSSLRYRESSLRYNCKIVVTQYILAGLRRSYWLALISANYRLKRNCTFGKVDSTISIIN